MNDTRGGTTPDIVHDVHDRRRARFRRVVGRCVNEQRDREGAR